MTRQPPREVLELFDDPGTIGRGRALAVEWLMSITPELRVGDVVMMPNAVTGDLESYSYNPKRPQ